MDPRSIGARPVLHFTGSDDRGDVLHDEDDAANGDGSGAAENDDTDAAGVRDFFVSLFQRLGALFFYEQHGWSFAAVIFESR